MAHQYLTLIASLPPHMPKLFSNTQTPISRLKLDERLQMLEPGDANDLSLVENLVHWDHMSMETSDAEMIKRGEQAMDQIKSEFIREEVRWRMELRTAVAALRRRHSGRDTPGNETKWGFGRWLRYIESHWYEPAFGLDGHFPWLPEANKLLKANDYLALERLILGVNWDYYGRIVGDHYFDFEAVVVYVLRWDIIERWSRYDSRKAEQRFENMLGTALGEYAEMFSRENAG